MLSNIFDRISFWSLFLTLSLLPIFFIPFSRISVESSKSFLLVLGLSLSVLFWTLARFQDKKMILPKSKVFLSAFAIVLVFLVSAIFSSVKSVSFFGTMFDVGSFWFIFAAFLFAFVCATILKDSKKSKMALFGILLSSSLLLFFQTLHLFFPQALSLGTLAEKTGNILGSWSAFGVFAGFFVTLSLFVIEFFYVSTAMKRFLGFFIILSLFLIATVNFPLIWILVGLMALLILLARLSFAKVEKERGETTKFPVFTLVIIILSLIFIIGGQTLGNFLPMKLKINSIEVRPSFSTTMVITQAALKSNPVLGIGPNRFAELWSLHKPANINPTLFWDTSFDVGSGTIPTLGSTTGILGIVSWIIFLALFILAGIKALLFSIRNGMGWDLVAFFLGALYLIVASIFYVTGVAILILALGFAGIFIGLAAARKGNGERIISFAEAGKTRHLFTAILIIILAGTLTLSFIYFKRFSSIPHFGRALTAATTAEAETEIATAIRRHQSDLYFRTFAQIILLKLGEQVSAVTGTLTEAQRAMIQGTFTQALNGASFAVAYNPNNQLNYRLLGGVYDAAIALDTEGAYAKSLEAYQKAATLNPLNPGIKLAIARASLADGKISDARTYAQEALKLKENYVDALITLAQIEQRAGNTGRAISYAEQALALVPGNQAVTNYLNTLRRGSTTSSESNTNN